VGNKSDITKDALKVL